MHACIPVDQSSQACVSALSQPFSFHFRVKTVSLCSLLSPLHLERLA